MGIETICEGGLGGSAKVYIQLRKIFPGLGGTLTTEQDFVVAYRLPSSINLEQSEYKDEEEYNYNLLNKKAKESLIMFLRHTLVKKLDDYFFRKGNYRFAHIPRPLGSTNVGGYLYEWVHGTEGFYSYHYDRDTGTEMPIKIEEWDTVFRCFQDAGINIFYDVTDAEDGRYTKNVIVQEPYLSLYPEYITKLWKRIDFGPESLTIDYHKLEQFLNKNEKELNSYLNPERVEMIKLILHFLQGEFQPDNNPEYNKLTKLVRAFRISTVEHMGIQGKSSFEKLKKCVTKKLTEKEKIDIKEVSFVKPIQKSDNSELFLEIRSGFRSIDGIIFTLQEIPVARITYLNEKDPDMGFKIFLRHFIAKKLENAFISEGRYSYAHIPRPLGSEGFSYYYDWAWGEERCQKSLIEQIRSRNPKMGLSEWDEFISYFEEAGIDFKSKLKFVSSQNNPDRKIVKYIIVRQPYSEIEDTYISRLWKRINFHENGTLINLEMLEKYLLEKEDYLKNYLTPGRYETMILATRFLSAKKLSSSDIVKLKDGIHDYRVSALRHLNHYGFGPPPYGFADLKVVLASEKN